jgi:hypothetical protein
MMSGSGLKRSASSDEVAALMCFGIHTFRMIDSGGKSTFVKFHWNPKLGLQSVVWNEAVKINGADPDFHRRDLWDAIGLGDFPRMGIGAADLRRRVCRQVRVRRPRPDQTDSRRGTADPDRRSPGAGSPRRQLLRGDGAGRLLHAEHRPGHRFQQRPAASGPQLLLCQHRTSFVVRSIATNVQASPCVSGPPRR